MAPHLFAPLPEHESRKYESGHARDELCTGDVLLFRGSECISRAIRLVTHGAYSHSGLVYRFEGHVYCLEAVGPGVRLIRLSVLLRDYEGGIDAFAVRRITEAGGKTALGFAFQQLGKPYDTVGIAKFLWAMMFGKMKGRREKGHWFCSELVAKAWDVAGVDLLGRHWPEAFVSPEMLAESAELAFRFRIKPE